MDSISSDESTLKDRLVVLTKQLAEAEGLKKSANKKFNDDIADLKFEIKATMETEFGYKLDFTLDELRPAYSWGYPGAALCQGTVPQAIRCVLEASDYEDAIRNAVSLGGDSDTLACIAGAIAEPVFGIPKKIRTIGMNILKHYFPEPYKLVNAFEKKFGSRVLE
jgi:ADP-ribosylglycohydrolase